MITGNERVEMDQIAKKRQRLMDMQCNVSSVEERASWSVQRSDLTRTRLPRKLRAPVYQNYSINLLLQD